MPAFEVTAEGLLGRFLATEIDGLKRECRKRSPEELEDVISSVSEVT
jgi:hypothetical protein